MSSNMQDSKVGRRAIFAGVGALGALAGVAALVPQYTAPGAGAPVQPAGNPADGPDGYQVTPHVQRYYQSARI